MIGAITFLVVLSVIIFKMVYDHQLVKDLQKIETYGQEEQEATQERVPNETKAKSRRVGRRNAGK